MNTGTQVSFSMRMPVASIGVRMIVATTLLVSASAAHAKVRIPIPVMTGNEVFYVGPMPPTLAAQANEEVANWNLGYLCDHFGILGADVWTWNCKLVAYDRNKGYTDLPEESRRELEAEYPMSKAERGVWNHYGFVVVLLALGGLGAIRGGAA